MLLTTSGPVPTKLIWHVTQHVRGRTPCISNLLRASSLPASYGQQAKLPRLRNTNFSTYRQYS